MIYFSLNLLLNLLTKIASKVRHLTINDVDFEGVRSVEPFIDKTVTPFDIAMLTDTLEFILAKGDVWSIDLSRDNQNFFIKVSFDNGYEADFFSPIYKLDKKVCRCGSARLDYSNEEKDNISRAEHQYGRCSKCGTLCHPGAYGHYGYLTIEGDWICYHSCSLSHSLEENEFK